MKFFYVIPFVMLLSFNPNRGIAGKGCYEFGCRSTCERICCPEPIVENKKKSCYYVECKEICIPAIRFPWSKKCNEARRGKVRVVKVLRKREFTCDQCSCQWNIEPVCVSSDSCTSETAPATHDTKALPPAPAAEGQATKIGVSQDTI